MSRNRFSKLIGIVLVTFFLIGGLPWRELKADAETHCEYNCSPLLIVYDQTASWDTTTQAQYTVTNSSSEPVVSWKLELNFSSDVTITNLWNAQDVSDSTPPANSLLIGNEVYNGTVNPGETITFGMTVTGSEYAPVAPLSVHLINGSEPDITPEITPVPYNEEDPFTYAIFAGSPAADLTISGWKTNISGDIYTGRDFLYQGSELTVNGTARTVGTIRSSGWTTSISAIEENAIPLEMPDWSETILNLANIMDQMDSSAFTSQQDIVANGYYYSDGNLTINSSTFDGTAAIVSDGDITINADILPGEGTLILYSQNGNITINSTEASINGILYAPNGRVALNGNNITVNGRIVANEFLFGGSTLTVTTAEEDLWFLDEDPDITPTSVPTITPEPTTEPTPSVEPTITVTPVPSVTTVPTVTSEPTVTPIITIDPTPTTTEAPTPTPIDKELDSDEDGIPDYLEVELGTNPNDPDTDGDGLNDLLEFMTGYDPTKVDTDDNGVPDGDEDLDEDGLSNIAELNLGTEILSADTDCDGISDGSEVNVYGTDPLFYDSDNDGIRDGDELTLGKNPTDPADAAVRILQTTEEEINNSEDPAITSVRVTMELADLITRSLDIRDMYKVDYYSTDVAGRIGSPVSFECEETFDTATVVFHYDDTKLGETREEDLGVLWFDEENRIYIMQEQAVLDTVSNTITLELNHFSTYVIVDRFVWDSAVPPYYDFDTVYTLNDNYAQHYDVVFAINISSSMGSTERTMAIETIENFLSCLGEGDRVGYALFGRRHRDFYDLRPVNGQGTINPNVSYYINTMSDSGVANLYNARAAAELNFDENESDQYDNTKIIIVISDGNVNYSLPASNLVFNVYDPAYYALSIPGTHSSVYETTMLGNHGQYFPNCMQADLPEYILQLEANETVDFSPIDGDGDGLPDVIEENGMFATNRHVYTSDPGEPDSDNDQLSDGQEMGEMYSIRRIDEDRVQIRGDILDISDIPSSEYAFLENCISSSTDEIRFVFKVYADPEDRDSDDDFYFDYREQLHGSNPLECDIETMGLGGQPYIITNTDLGYIHVWGVPEDKWDEPDEIQPYNDGFFYGGNQSWFSDIIIDISGVHFFLNQAGCGVIASNDVLYYLENNCSTIEWNDYRNSILYTNNGFVGLSGIVCRLNTSFVIPPVFVSDYLSREGVNANDLSITSHTESQEVLDKIINSIKENHPVILLTNTLFSNKDDNMPLYYINSSFEDFTHSNLLIMSQSTDFHYVTITGVYFNRVENKTYLRVQSWGREFYVDYYDYANNCMNGLDLGSLVFVS